MKRIALLGGSRFIGYHLLLALIREGHEVTIFNRGISRPPAAFPNNIRILNGDRNSLNDMDRLFDQDYDVVFDISGFNPDHLGPIINSHRSRIGHYIFCSSASVYQDQLCSQREESPLTLIKKTYGGDKAQAENLLMDQYKETQWPVTILRPYAVFGPYDNRGSTNLQLGFIFHRVINSIPIPLKSRSQGRLNLLYVDDLVNGFIRCMENSVSHGKIYNIAGDDLTSEQEVIEIIGKICMLRPNIYFVANQDYRDIKMGGPWLGQDWILDNTKIKKELEFEFNSLEIVLTKICTWFCKTSNFPKLAAIRGEKYLLENKKIPKLVRSYWKWSDGVHPFLMSLYQKIGGRNNKLLRFLINNVKNLLQLK